jgi:hypothetical protein
MCDVGRYAFASSKPITLRCHISLSIPTSLCIYYPSYLIGKIGDLRNLTTHIRVLRYRLRRGYVPLRIDLYQSYISST